jgi:hypothetical protein
MYALIKGTQLKRCMDIIQLIKFEAKIVLLFLKRNASIKNAPGAVLL